MNTRNEKNDAFVLRAKRLYAPADFSAPATRPALHGPRGRSTKTMTGRRCNGIDNDPPRRMQSRGVASAAVARPMRAVPRVLFALPAPGCALQDGALPGKGRRMTPRTVPFGRPQAPPRRRIVAARGLAPCTCTAQADILRPAPPLPLAPAPARPARAARSGAPAPRGPISAPAARRTLSPVLPARARPVLPHAPSCPRRLSACIPAHLFPTATFPPSATPAPAARSWSGCDRARRMVWMPVRARPLPSRSMSLPCARHARTRAVPRRAGLAIGAPGGAGAPPPLPRRCPAGVHSTYPSPPSPCRTATLTGDSGGPLPLPRPPQDASVQDAMRAAGAGGPLPLPRPPQAHPAPSTPAHRPTARSVDFGSHPARSTFRSVM